ncbi:MAG: glycosyltransferase [Bacillota bacterium]
MNKNKVLIGSPIRQKPAILKEFLHSLTQLEKQNLSIDFFFIDDNELEETKKILNSFSCQESAVHILEGEGLGQYLCDEKSHHWKESLIWKVAEYKDRIIRYAQENNYDFLFLIDSDLLLHPLTLLHLISTGKDIISEIFWSKWEPELPPLPQVWINDQYNLCYRYRNENLSQDEAKSRIKGFLHCLEIPGIYEVGGLGACTLISKKALAAGVCFKEIKNLSLWGEDRHFCIRAAALGFKLFADTFYPAYHIYRETELKGVSDYKQNMGKITYPNGTKPVRSNTKSQNNKLTLSMLVRNEADRYLPDVLRHAALYIDEAVILDDASEDNTVQMCKNILGNIPLKIVTNETRGFHNEVNLRRQQWDVTVSTNPDWILCLDADEIFENQTVDHIRFLINQPYFDYYGFRLYDFWDTDHYREDKYWEAHKYFRSFLVRFQPNFSYQWKNTPLHCGRFPSNITELPGAISRLRVKHLGWATSDDREKKYHSYMELDPEGKFGVMEQYKSILDPNPTLVKWQE